MSRAKTIESSYDPPRARWYSALYVPWMRMRRDLHLDAIRLPAGLGPLEFVLCLIVPGFGFRALGRRVLGRSFQAAYCLASVIFVVGLGYLAGSTAFGIMIAIHACSIVFLLDRWIGHEKFGFRLAIVLGTLLALWLVIYTPALGFIERNWIMPLRTRDSVAIIWCGARPDSFKRNDWMAYRIEEDGGAGVVLREGYGLNRVLALPGDRVEYTPERLLINDKPYPREPLMPEQGTFVVPQKEWFCWPGSDIMAHGGHGPVGISAVMQKAALVRAENVLGKPFNRWFGRRQLP